MTGVSRSPRHDARRPVGRRRRRQPEPCVPRSTASMSSTTWCTARHADFAERDRRGAAISRERRRAPASARSSTSAASGRRRDLSEHLRSRRRPSRCWRPARPGDDDPGGGRRRPRQRRLRDDRGARRPAAGHGLPALGLDPDAAHRDRRRRLLPRRCVRAAETLGQTFEAGGPEVISYRGMIEQIAAFAAATR